MKLANGFQVEKMKEIARIKAKEEKKKLDSEVRINSSLRTILAAFFFPPLMNF